MLFRSNGPHRDHVIAFARRHGRDAIIVAVARWLAPFTQSGRMWPRPDAFDGTIDVTGYATEAGTNRLPLSTLFEQLPVAVLRARVPAKRISKRKQSHP